MEKQRAPYLKNLKRESDMGKFINRRNERWKPVGKTVFTADEIELLTTGIKEQNIIIKQQAKRINELENALALTFEQVYDNPAIDALVERALTTQDT